MPWGKVFGLWHFERFRLLGQLHRCDLLQQVVPIPGLLLEHLIQTGQVRLGKLRQVPGKLVAQTSCLANQLFSALQQSLERATRCFELLELGLGAQEATRVLEDSLTAIVARR